MKKVLLFFAFALMAGPSLAATVTVSTFSASAYSNALGGASAVATETFEGFGEGNVADGFSTAVGTFSTLGGVGTGGTVTDAEFSNNGAQLALRDGNVFGRTSSTADLAMPPANGLFLDSNDTFGIVWTVSLGQGGLFDRIVFSVTDAAEFGGIFRITAGDATATIENGENAARKLVVIAFDQGVSSARVTLGHFAGSQNLANDGFSIDDLAVIVIPLPASAFLLLACVGGLAMLRRNTGAAQTQAGARPLNQQKPLRSSTCS